MTTKTTDINKWYQSVWLPFAAATYIVICIFDFIIMPVYVTAHNSRIENAVLRTLDSKDAATFADGLVKANQAARQWNPLTLLGAGMFHLAFGALLTGGAVTRGMAKKTEVESYYKYNSPGYPDEYYDYEQDSRYNNYRQPYRSPPPRYRQPPPSTATQTPMAKAPDLDEENG